MLGKLIKYDFKSTSRIMWLLYLGLIVVGALLGIIFRLIGLSGGDTSFGLMSLEAGSMDKVWEILLSSFAIVFVLLIQAVAIMTIVMIILRFNKNLLGGEGYLMHTLPVRTEALIGSKLIVSIIWMAIAVIAGLLSILMLGATSGWLGWMIKELSWEDVKEVLSTIFSLNGWLGFILVRLSGISFITKCYACMAIGNLANKNKFLFAVLAYLAISVITSIITSVIGVASGGLIQWVISDKHMTGALVAGIASELVLGVGFFIAADLILKKRLNLA